MTNKRKSEKVNFKLWFCPREENKNEIRFISYSSQRR